MGFLLGFPALAFLCAIACVWVTYDAVQFRSNAESATGTVIGYEERVGHPNESPPTIQFGAYIAFTTPANETFVHQTDMSTRQPAHAPGEQVDLHYDPSDPNSVVLDTWWDRWFGSVIAAFLTLIFSGAAAFVALLTSRWQSRSARVGAEDNRRGRNGFLFVFPLLFGVVCALLVYGTVHNTGRHNRLMSETEAVTGVVASDQRGFAPLIDFSTSNGRTVRYQPRWATHEPIYEVGDRVELIHAPGDPTNAIIYAHSPPLVEAVVGWVLIVSFGAVAAVGLMLLIVARFRDVRQ